MPIETWLHKLALFFRSLFRRDQVKRELDEEFRFHLERKIELNLQAGMSIEEAKREALHALGNVDAYKEQCRDSWVSYPVDVFVQDLIYAIRVLRKDLWFSISVLLLLSLSIGATVTVFSIVNGVLFEELPYADPDELVVFHESLPESGEVSRSVNVMHYLRWKECECLDDIALGQFVYDVNLSHSGEPERVPSLRVTSNTFSVLGVNAQVGRVFGPNSLSTVPDGIIISDSLWRSRFGASSDVIGQQVEIDGSQAIVIGVLPESFRFDWALANSGDTTSVDIYRIWNLEPYSQWNWTANYTFAAVGRLADGVSLAAASDAINIIQSGISAENFDGRWAGMTLRSTVTPLSQWITRDVRSGLWLLLGGVASAFFVACLNIANLMLVRASARRREAGVRAALGATRISLFRAVLIESSLLAFAGALMGALIGWTGLSFLQSMQGIDLPRLEQAQVSWPIWVGCFGVAVIATISFGLFPALRTSRTDPQVALRQGGRTITESSSRLGIRQLLIGAEIALTSGLLILAGLMLASYLRLDTVDRGFDAQNVLTAEIGLPGNRYSDNTSRLQFYSSVIENLEAQSGVIAAGITSHLPLHGQRWTATAVRAGSILSPDEQPLIDYRFVSPGYFEAMGIPLLSGRGIGSSDDGRTVGIFSERASEIVFGSSEAVGSRYNPASTTGIAFEVIGIVPDVHSNDIASTPVPIVYEPLTSPATVSPVVSVVVRTVGDPWTAAASIRNAVRTIDPSLSVSKIRSMEGIEGASLGERRLRTALLSGFAVAALLIAALGTYSVMAFAANGRKQEIAIRMALGARRSMVATALVLQGMKPVLAGLCAGVAAALLLGGTISGMLFEVAPTDSKTISSVLVVILVAALAACLVPAWRASQTSLTRVLREI